jgi:hypothetical protein
MSAHRAKGVGMDEQPHEGPTEQQSESSDGPQKFFKSMNGMIAGATALLIALGGLATTWDKIFGGKPAAQAAASTEAPAKGGQPQAAADVPVQPAADLPLLYEGDDVKLEFADDKWVLTDADGTYDYEELLSPDEDRVLAYSKPYDSYLRWPVKGGWAEESTDDKQSWKRYAELYPPES